LNFIRRRQQPRYRRAAEELVHDRELHEARRVGINDEFGAVRWNQYIECSATFTILLPGIPGNINNKAAFGITITNFQVIGDNSTFSANSQTVTLQAERF
jgi:hypothetical protein